MMTKIEMQAMDAVIGIHREIKKASEVNWEQRRYEIAKEIYPTMVAQMRVQSGNTLFDGIEAAAKATVVLADALVKELKPKS